MKFFVTVISLLFAFFSHAGTCLIKVELFNKGISSPIKLEKVKTRAFTIKKDKKKYQRFKKVYGLNKVIVQANSKKTTQFKSGYNCAKGKGQNVVIFYRRPNSRLIQESFFIPDNILVAQKTITIDVSP